MAQLPKHRPELRTGATQPRGLDRGSPSAPVPPDARANRLSPGPFPLCDNQLDKGFRRGKAAGYGVLRGRRREHS